MNYRKFLPILFVSIKTKQSEFQTSILGTLQIYYFSCTYLSKQCLNHVAYPVYLIFSINVHNSTRPKFWDWSFGLSIQYWFSFICHFFVCQDIGPGKLNVFPSYFGQNNRSVTESVFPANVTKTRSKKNKAKLGKLFTICVTTGNVGSCLSMFLFFLARATVRIFM